MKELSVEQKAKAYDKVRDKIAIRFGSNVAKEIFSEFDESEDERIRKGLIAIITDFESLYLQENYSLSREDTLAWLEKQDEHANFCNKIQIGDKVTRNQDGVLVNLSQLKRVAKPAENKGTNLSEEEMTPFQKKVFCIVDTAIEEEQGLSNICNELLALAIQDIEQNPWSEEDEMFVHGLIRGLKAKRDIHGHITFSSDNLDITKTIEWLDSLKDRVQPKQEWSEEDRDLIEEIISHYRHLIAIGSLDSERYKNYIIPKLKSLRPQDTLKPTEEQMDALESAVSSLQSTALESLYRNLKGYE